MSLPFTTKLDAVNKMLEAVWELPVSSLIGSASGAVAMAKRLLDETSISVQSRGWAFNTEEGFTLSPDTDGSINLPANCIEARPMGASNGVQAVMRGTRLYDRENHTFTFTQPVTVRLITHLEFEDLPQAARFYIAVMATRIFAHRYLEKDGESSISQEEMEALRDLEEHEGSTNRNNMLSDSWSVACIIDR